MAIVNKDEIKIALDNLSEAAAALGCHGYDGYTTDSSALDVVFVRALYKLWSAIRDNPDTCERYDPEGFIYEVLPSSDHF